MTGERWMWLRATGSTAVSQLFDSFIVLYIAFVLGPQHWPVPQFLAVGTVNYLYKMLAAVAMIPLLYLVHAGVRRYLGRAEVERMRARGCPVNRPWDEMIGADGRARAHCRNYSDWLLAQGMDRLDDQERGGRCAVPSLRHHLCGLRPGRGHGTADSLRCGAARAAAGRVAEARGRPQAARQRAQCLHRRHLRRAGHPARRRDSRRSRCCATASTGPKCRASPCRSGSTRISPAST